MWPLKHLFSILIFISFFISMLIKPMCVDVKKKKKPVYFENC